MHFELKSRNNTDWFVKYACFAKKQGIINGYNDGSFRASQTISFAEAAKMITNTMLEETPAAIGDKWYMPFVAQLNNFGVSYSWKFLTNPDSGEVIPSAIVTRGDMVEMIYSAKNIQFYQSISLIESDGTVKYSSSLGGITYQRKLGDYTIDIQEKNGALSAHILDKNGKETQDPLLIAQVYTKNVGESAVDFLKTKYGVTQLNQNGTFLLGEYEGGMDTDWKNNNWERPTIKGSSVFAVVVDNKIPHLWDTKWLTLRSLVLADSYVGIKSPILTNNEMTVKKSAGINLEADCGGNYMVETIYYGKDFLEVGHGLQGQISMQSCGFQENYDAKYGNKVKVVISLYKDQDEQGNLKNLTGQKTFFVNFVD
ncbi:MAG: S-layer homology domain-containing protein [Candidatus Peregrinibacteria bacterium]